MNRRYSTCTRGSAGLGRLWRGLWFVSLSSVVGGCLGGQTGTEANGKGGETPTTTEPDTGAACVPEVTALAAGETSPLGFAPDSVLPAVTGSRSTTLKWSEPPLEADFGPEQGASTVVLEVNTSSAGARFVHWAPRALGPDVGGCAPDEVQLDARISFFTGGGAFAEQFAAVLHVTAPDAARITLSLPLATLTGAFIVSPSAGVRTSAVVFDAKITAEGTTGTLRGQLEQTRGNVASVRSFTYACWPADDPTCSNL